MKRRQVCSTFRLISAGKRIKYYIVLKTILNVFTIIIIALIAIIGTPSVFGESPVLIQTDKKEYSMGEDIILQGTVKFANDKVVEIRLPGNLDVAIEVYNSKNRIVTAYIADVKNDGTFSLKIKTGEDSPILTKGKYFLVAYYGIAAHQLLITDFVGRYDIYVGVNSSNPSPTTSSTPNSSMSDDTTPNSSMSDDTTPNSSMSDDTTPNSSMSDDTTSNSMTHDPVLPPPPKSEHWILIGISAAVVVFLAIIIKKNSKKTP